ncbi:protein transport protein Sec31A isoform X1 [Glossina fuscipes]|uniref:Protein transport protein Sec31A n=1 Tax=Glossina fuscipes TaxID=7396 RepID=A0A9C5Z0Z1_9MUSC|nr:protein transport protein Sec31A isoform X1 [Glossina fuscipes]
MKIKELQKTVNIAWSPAPQQPIYLATGTAAQQFDSNAASVLEIYSTNFSDPSYDLELITSLSSQYRFQKLIWSPTGFGSAHRNGLLVGGCEGGHVMIYSPAKMLAEEDGLIARQDKHTGPVRGLDFNPFQSNLLASCASESEIFIWDLNNTATHMNPGTKTMPLDDVKNVAWNRQVQHILASVFSTRCVIWDLRKSEQIIKLSDTQSHVRWHAIQWHPDMATQVWLASEDDQAPVVQLWDLRYATAPAKTMQIHQRGVLGMSWCPSDTDLMVSCGKDNRIYCWNPNTPIIEGEILSEVATTATWYSDVQWCPRNPALIACSSLDGNVSIYSLFGGTQQQVQTSNKIADSFPGMDQFANVPIPQQCTPTIYNDLKYAPKWIKKPVGTTFGFGGKLVSFNSKNKTVTVSQVTTEPKLVERARALEKSLSEAKFSDYCRQKADQMPDQSGRYLWYFIKANFERNPKEEILNLLGFNKEDIDGKFAKYVAIDAISQLSQDVEQITNRVSHLTHSPQVDQAAMFDDIIARKNNDKSDVQKPLTQFKIPIGEHPDSLITEALLTGNIEAAVQLCVDSKRIAEALIIASTAGIDFLTKIQNHYLQEQKNELSQVISAVATSNWMNFINSCAIESWKEALVAVLKHDERKAINICERLGDRLLKECSHSPECTRSAMLCFVCAGNIDKLIDSWHHLKRLEHQNPQHKLNTDELQELAEIVMLMNKSLEEQGVAVEINGEMAEFLTEYAGLLVAQGAFTTALSYMLEIKASAMNSEIDDLRQRIFNIVQPQSKAIAPNFNLPQQQSQNTYQVQQQSQNNYQAQQQVPQLQQQSRGNFSNSTPINNMNFRSDAPTFPAQTAWNANAISNNMPPPAGSSVPFNPPVVGMPTHIKPLNNAEMPQPPRPVSAASSQDGSSRSGLHSRFKYVLDPSVAAADTMAGYGNSYNAPPLNMPVQNYNVTPLNSQPMGALPMQSAYNPTPFSNSNNSYMPSTFPVETAALATSPPGLSQRNPTPPPGWNDPPALKFNAQNYFYTNTKNEMYAQHAGTRKWQKIINHDLQNKKSSDITKTSLDSNNYNYNVFSPTVNTSLLNQSSLWQQQIPNMPPIQHSSMLSSAEPPQGIVNQTWAGVSALNNNQTQQQPYNFQTAGSVGNQLPNQKWQSQPNIGYNDDQLQQQQQQPLTKQITKEKPPLPEEYIYLQMVLEELKNQCLHKATDPRTKRKFVDVVKRLENLYDCLRDGRLTTATVQSLNQIVQFIQIGDYGNALQTHTQIAFGSDFSQCAGFMPGLKVLIQSANELQVYLR